MERNLLNIIEEYIGGSSFGLIDIKQKGNKGNIILEVYIDKKESFGIDEIADINRGIWKTLEEKNMDKGILKMIVSSPGAENPIKYFWQLEKHIGRDVDVKMKNGLELTGKFDKILNADTEEMQIEQRDKKGIKYIVFTFGDLSEIKIKPSLKK